MKYLTINFLMLFSLITYGQQNSDYDYNKATTNENEIKEVVATVNFEKNFITLSKLNDYIDYKNIEFDEATYSYPVFKRKKINSLASFSLLSKLNDIYHYHYLVYKFRLTEDGVSKKEQIIKMLVNEITINTDIKDIKKHFEEIKITNNINFIIINPENKDFEDEITIIIDKEQSYSAEINDPDGYTNIRKEPSTNSAIIGKFEKGYIFDVYKCDNSQWWLTISKNGQIGYIHKTRVFIYDDM